MGMIDPRDFHDGPAPEGDPFEAPLTSTPSFGIGPDGIDNLRRTLGLPAPPERDPVTEFGDPESKW